MFLAFEIISKYFPSHPWWRTQRHQKSSVVNVLMIFTYFSWVFRGPLSPPWPAVWLVAAQSSTNWTSTISCFTFQASLGQLPDNRSPYLPARILKVYIVPLMGFSHAYQSDGLNITLLSQALSSKTAPALEMVDWRYLPKTVEGLRSPQLLSSSLRVNCWSCPLDDLFQHTYS